MFAVDEGPVFAMCMTSQGDQATLNQWISSLQKSNPILSQVPTLFRLDSGPQELQGVETESGHQHRSTEVIMEKELTRSQGMKQ